MSARQPFQLVEIDLDYCGRTYGLGACGASLGTTGRRKCFNTLATCQWERAFTRQVRTLRFATPTTALPKGLTIFPCLRSISARPASVNIAGVDESRGPLGRRATVTIEMADFPYHDRLLDRYWGERRTGAAQADGVGYEPADFGTFFGRLRARWPYYAGRALRIIDGYLAAGEIAEAVTRAYVITGWDGPGSDGGVTFEAKDILALADDDKALAPRPSRGRLSADIEAGAAGAVLVPEGVGAEYPSSGEAVIGSEVVGFVRAGDALVLTRGVAGTQAASHRAGDTVQEILRVEAARVDDAIRTLLGFAGTPSDYIDDWAPEVTRWLPGLRLDARITAPTGVASLIGELAILGVSIWWDEVAQKIRLRANRPPDGEAVIGLNDRAHIVAAEVEDRPDERLTQVLFYHHIVDPTKSPTDPSNFRRMTATVDLAAEEAYGDTRVRRIFSRWLGPTQDNEVAGISSRLLARFRATPRLLTLTLDAKDRAISLADVAEVETRVMTDAAGRSVGALYQVTAVEHRGHQVEATLQSYQFAGRFIFVLPNDAPDYEHASDEQRQNGFWIADDDGLMPDGSPAYQII